MATKIFMNGDEAIAYGVKLSKVEVVSAYPITPQTIVVEKLSEFVANDAFDAEYIHVESEHSAMSAAIGAAAVGARTFTATSSQGLLYMIEAVYYASGARYPIVMMNANRALAAPWNIYGDQSDALSQLNSGWIQVYVEDAQEALDMIIQAYRIAEDFRVVTPMMVNLDGFTLTHTYEPVTIPNQDDVDAFLPPCAILNKMDVDSPVNACMSAGNQWHLEFRMKQALGIEAAREVIDEVDTAFGKQFGRAYGGLIEAYCCEDAEAVLVTLGSVTGTARMVVNQMRQNGKKVGLLKVRYMRPFPSEKIIAAIGNAKAIGVLDKDLSFGYEGTVYTNVNSALFKAGIMVPTVNFVGGIGGRDISKENIFEIYETLLNVDEAAQEKIQYVNVRCS
jgi:pyruvate ferredoxin oxidoreductase alpha subunit